MLLLMLMLLLLMLMLMLLLMLHPRLAQRKQSQPERRLHGRIAPAPSSPAG
jgi:hypothetical protein